MLAVRNKEEPPLPNPSILGKASLEAMPYIMQAFVKRSNFIKSGKDFERKLYIVRRNIEKRAGWISKFLNEPNDLTP